MKTLPHHPTTRVSKGGNRIVMTEWEVRDIDEHGDAQSVDHFSTKDKALAAAQEKVKRLPLRAPLTGGGEQVIAALVVEKHVSRRPAHLSRDPDVYTTVATFGSAEALRAGGWLEDGT